MRDSCARGDAVRRSRRAGGVVAGEAVRRRRLVKAESVGARRGKEERRSGRGGEERRSGGGEGAQNKKRKMGEGQRWYL